MRVCALRVCWCLLVLLRRRWPWPGGDTAAADLSEQTDAAKAAAADVLGTLMAQPSHGPRVSLLMGKLLPPGLVASIAEGPPAAVLRALGQVRMHACLHGVEGDCWVYQLCGEYCDVGALQVADVSRVS